MPPTTIDGYRLLRDQGPALADRVRRAAMALLDPETDPNGYNLSEEQLESARRMNRIEMARAAAKAKNILLWGSILFPEKFKLPFCKELHNYMVETRKDEFTNTEAPRNHAKTTIKCFLIPIFQALEEPDTFRHYLNCQATGIKALTVNRAIREELERNEDLLSLYGNQLGERWTDQQFVLRNGVIFTAISAGQSIRGLNYRNIRPDYILVDDLYDEEDINNMESTEKKNEWFWGTLYPARAKSVRCSIHVQGTAINGEDLLEKLKKQSRWKSATFQAVKDFDAKVVLWPELNTFESLMDDRKDMGSVIFFRELQNVRRDDATSIIKKAWIKEYLPREIAFTAKFRCVAVRLLVDPSVGKKVENDPTAMALMIVGQYADGRGEIYYIEQVWNEQLSLHKRIQKMQDIGDQRPPAFPITQARIEAIAGFGDFANEAKRKTNLPIKEIPEVKDKITNLENKSHFFENSKVYINCEIEPSLKQELIHQLTNNHPKHDDMRDAVLLGLDNKGTLDYVG